MEPLLYAAPPDIVECILRQLSKVLPNDPSARRIFQTVGGLKKIQELKGSPSSEVTALITNINSCYSDEVIKFYTSSKSRTISQVQDSSEKQFKAPKDYFAGGDPPDALSTDQSNTTLGSGKMVIQSHNME